VTHKVLLTGATGFIGSHTWLALLSAGFEVVGVDNFCNSSPAVLGRLATLSGQSLVFEQADVADAAALAAIFQRHRVAAVIHFAAFKAVGESAQKPLAYYANNLGSLLTLCQVMSDQNVKTLVFSSSATVYGNPLQLPFTEDHPLNALNTYGRTKLMGEQILQDLGAADAGWRLGLLRYFNPVGAHESGLIGEDPRGTPNNLMPYVAQVAVGQRPQLAIFGGDYPTPDGTGVRDYLHVLDLAQGHVAALRYLLGAQRSITVNLGTGVGYSVLEVVRAFEQASGRVIPYQIVPRRAGDVASSYADTTLAQRLLNWRAERSLLQMCADSWRWQQANPRGYE
jgi:UDP-glucose 4-epimerase